VGKQISLQKQNPFAPSIAADLQRAAHLQNDVMAGCGQGEPGEDVRVRNSHSPVKTQ
jgi:hypothetical protein